jgi:HlyD family secretion protein
MSVSVAPVQTNVKEQVFGLGTVGARVRSNVGFKVAGVLGALDADQGDVVPADRNWPASTHATSKLRSP